MVIKRLIDYGILIFMLYPCIRYVLVSTKFVLDYSRLSIKPMLTRINDDGLRAFGPFLCFNIFLATTANVAFFTCASFMNTGPLYGDFPILACISMVVLFWSIGMPYSIYRSARGAKFSAVHTYAQHIEDAFRLFLKDPGEPSLERYTWLVKNQTVISKISNWPLSFLSTLLFVVGSNVLLLTTNVWFVFKRLGHAPVLLNALGEVLFWR